MSDHSKFAPSSMGRLMQCAGSLNFASLYPQEVTSVAADEGTLAHEVAAVTLLAGTLPEGATDEMCEFAENYRSYVQPDKTTHVEEWVDCAGVYPGCFGTPDAYKIKREIKLLMIWDYKFGFRPVEVKNN